MMIPMMSKYYNIVYLFGDDYSYYNQMPIGDDDPIYQFDVMMKVLFNDGSDERICPSSDDSNDILPDHWW